MLGYPDPTEGIHVLNLFIYTKDICGLRATRGYLSKLMPRQIAPDCSQPTN